ncbi:MAG: DMT family protein [Candidatus Cryptobacteroides sp.]
MTYILPVLLLIVSNVFMTLAWYGNLKLQQMNLINDWPLALVILLSWGVALFEYSFMIPANRIGFSGNGGPYSLVQLKVIQEVVSLTVFTVMCILVFKTETFHWNHLVSALCLILAVFFAFLK